MALSVKPSKRTPQLGVVNNKLDEVDDFDLELPHAAALLGSHINLIPMQSAVQGPRLFYGARFMNQAMPLQHPEEALVQNLDEESGRSFDDIMGKHAGAVFADSDGEVEDVTKSHITIKQPDGTKKMVELYENMPFNRSTAIHNSPSVAVGDKVKAGQLLARSNFTDHKGTLALGVNARVALVPFKGYSMDDAIVISEPFAKRLTSEHTETHTQDYDSDTRGGLHHFASLFPHEFTKDQLANIDENGIVKPGTVLHPGDPLMLATRPRTMTSSSAQLGKLSKAVSSTRSKAAQTWDYDEQGVVTDVAKTKTGYKVITQRYAPMKVGDKLVMRQGQKGIVAKVLPEAHMPRTADGQPMEVLLNQLGLPSRVNAATLYEVLLGKVAAKTGTPEKLPGFPKEKWHDIVRKKMADAGVRETEQLYDPLENRMLENEVTTGNAYILKLLHVVEKKSSARGTGSYDNYDQPSKGSGPNAQAKRLSGLDSAALMSSGAYKTLKEGATLRGARNDAYWRQVRSGQTPKPPGIPFAFSKFEALLCGTGMQAKNIGKGKLRLSPFTDRDLESHRAIEIKRPDLVDPYDLTPVDGGLFDPGIVGSGSWGKITLPHVTMNPAFEHSIRTLLNLTQKQLRDIYAGKMELPENLR